MQINRRVNQGTPRGAGNIKGEDIKNHRKQGHRVLCQTYQRYRRFDWI